MAHPWGMALAPLQEPAPASRSSATGAEAPRAGSAGAPRQARASAEDSLELSPEARRKVTELKRTDQEVRAHEAAHMAAGGSLVRGGASYGTERGPDGKLYAVSGEVSLDASPARTPEATLAKAQRVRAAALAPADPSAQDRAVAAQASAMAAEAAAELARQRMGGRLDVSA